MAIDVCPGPIQPIKQISDYFPRYPRGLPPTLPHVGPLRSALSTSSASASTTAAAESDRPNEDNPDRALAGASASLQATKKDEEPDVEGYDSDDSSEWWFPHLSPCHCLPRCFLTFLRVCVCVYPFQLFLSAFLLLLHLHFCHRLPGIPPALWLCGFICHLSLLSAPPSISFYLQSPGVCAHANSLPLSRQTANCCCCKEYRSPSFSTSSALLQLKGCVMLLKWMIAVIVCAFSSSQRLQGAWSILLISLTRLRFLGSLMKPQISRSFELSGLHL